ncbi:TF2H2 [Hepatospora eriocheir]|uniref:TF2H2 n=1 Tax=Hepatospora eriocheir TaxID=1081669 RepID=A0A1X0QIX4_9MICR|nr:TF2H2 [Hepatospora eriocheir]
MENKFSWTEEYKRTWEEVDNKIIKKDFKILQKFNNKRKAVIRHLLVVIDVSFAIEKNDYLPNLRSFIGQNLEYFESDFYFTNPLSTLSFLTFNDTFVNFFKEPSKNLLNIIGEKDFSFLSAIKTCIRMLKNSSFQKEVFFIISSIGSRDTDTVNSVIQELKDAHIKISIISLCGEVSVFKRITEITNGKFFVPEDAIHFRTILHFFTFPIENTNTKIKLMKLGFPEKSLDNQICTCHSSFNTKLYRCPTCDAAICNIPMECPVCELHLVSPTNVFKSYYFMSPLKSFIKLEEKNNSKCLICNNLAMFKCDVCNGCYCSDCDYQIHSDLNFCPNCK